MDQITLFNLTFPSYTATPRCQPNSSLSGVVMLKIARALEMQKLTVTVKGRERVALSLITLPSANSIDDLQTMQRYYFKHEQTISERPAAGYLTPGLHLFHFSCNFPNVNYPGSMREMHYAVDYSCCATLYTEHHKCHTTDLTILFEPTLEPFDGPSPRLMAPRAETRAVAEPRAKDKGVFKLRSQFSYQSYLPGEAVNLSLGLDPCVNVASIRKTEYRVIETTTCFNSGAWATRSRSSGSNNDITRDDYDESPLWSRDREIEPKTEFTLIRNTSHIHPISRWFAEIEFKMPKTARALPCAFLQFTYSIEIVVTFWSGLRTNRVASVVIPILVAPETLADIMPVGMEGLVFDNSTPTSRSFPSSIVSLSSYESLESTLQNGGATAPSSTGGRHNRKRRASPPHIFDLKKENLHIPTPQIETIAM